MHASQMLILKGAVVEKMALLVRSEKISLEIFTQIVYLYL